MHISKEAQMDEYTFILAAKLEADRRRLERESSSEAPRATPPQSRRPSVRHTSRKQSPQSPQVSPLRLLAWR
jgi:hypothetical protein